MSLSVAEAIAAHTCSTLLVAGLSRQIIREMNEMVPGVLIPINCPQVHCAVGVFPYLQAHARESLMHALREREATLIVNSAYRTLPQQVMLRAWYEAGRCEIVKAAPPGESPHESALALDVHAAITWKQAVEKHGWRYLGPGDPMHLEYHGEARHDLGHLGVKSFQRIANRNGHTLAEDGVFGAVTHRALLEAPATGWKE